MAIISGTCFCRCFVSLPVLLPTNHPEPIRIYLKDRILYGKMGVWFYSAVICEGSHFHDGKSGTVFQSKRKNPFHNADDYGYVPIYELPKTVCRALWKYCVTHGEHGIGESINVDNIIEAFRPNMIVIRTLILHLYGEPWHAGSGQNWSG